MTDPGRGGGSPSGRASGSGNDSEALLAQALRARAGGTPSLGRVKGDNPGSASRTAPDSGAERSPASPSLTLLQLILAAAIAGFVIGMLVAVISLV